MPYAISIDIAPLSMMVFKYDYVDKNTVVADAPAVAAIEKKPAAKKSSAKSGAAEKTAVTKSSSEKKSVEKKTTK